MVMMCHGFVNVHILEPSTGSADVCRGGPKACGVAARQTVARDTAFGLTEVRASSTWKC